MKMFISLLLLSLTLSFSMPTDGLVAYYPFSGNTIDSTGNSHDGTNHGAVLTEDRNGRANNAYYFNGSSYIEVPHASDLAPETFSIGAWVKLDGLPAGVLGTIVGKQTRSSARGGYCLYVPSYDPSVNGLATLTIDAGSNCGSSHCWWRSAWSQEPVPYQEWVHIIGTYDSECLKIYVNGNLEEKNCPEVSEIIHNTDPMGIGFEWVAGQNRYFTGSIDEVVIYNRALSLEEINQLIVPEPVIVEAGLTMTPQSLNITSQGNDVKATIEISPEYSITDISTIAISKINGEEINPISALEIVDEGDFDADGLPEVIVSFNRADVANSLSAGTAIITITGQLEENTYFIASDDIKVIDNTKDDDACKPVWKYLKKGTCK
ncbi:MAG: LamG domain-containing protein [Fibrobacteria bacterium]|nr:LamG domain-containing protein [Fibrobacteria bacterium]